MELVPLEELSKMIKKKRKRTGKKQKEAASYAEISPSQLNRIENNTVNPSYRTVYKLWEKLEELEDREIEHAEDLMNKNIEWINASTTLEEASKIMRENDYSQLPVRQDEETVGLLTDKDIMEASNPDVKAGEKMSSKPMEVSPDTKYDVIREILKDDPAVLVKNQDEYVGIITKSDML